MNFKILIQEALQEDIGSGDITTDAVVSPSLKAAAEIRAKQKLVLAGLEAARAVFAAVDPGLQWTAHFDEGDTVMRGKVLAAVSGRAASIVKGERVALNFLQHLSGIATVTRQFVDAVKGTKAKILDTRKTLPGWRALEKQAVRMGGGQSHREGLFDRYLVKNNHIDLAGGFDAAVEAVLKNKKKNVLLEVEVRNFEELKKALAYPIDTVLLDNFEPEQVKAAVKLGRGKVLFEASGGITLDNVALYAAAGVDFISVGALTHSAPAADLHLNIL